MEGSRSPAGTVSRGNSRLAGAFGEASAGHALAQPAFFEEIPFEAPELAVQEVTRHLDS